MNKRAESLIRDAIATADHEEQGARAEASNVGEPHHSRLIQRATEAQEAGAQLRALIGLAPGEEPWVQARAGHPARSESSE